MRHIIPISGKDSLATAIVQTTRDDKDYEFVFNPTGLELPEVFEWIKNVRQINQFQMNHWEKDANIPQMNHTTVYHNMTSMNQNFRKFRFSINLVFIISILFNMNLGPGFRLFVFFKK